MLRPMLTLPPADDLYRAVIERDRAMLGVFVVAVKTTGVFCRVGCPARAPKRENCEFFATPREALHAGYRACLRCRPLDKAPERPEQVTRLLRLVEASPGRRFTDERLRELGVDPSTARRQFLRHCGMTFHAYQRARRMGLALGDLRRNRSVARAMAASGFESTSGFGAAFRGIFGSPPSAAGRVEAMSMKVIETPLGPMVAIANDDGLVVLEFEDRRALEREVEWARRRFGAVVAPGDSPHLRSIERELEEYFGGERARFETPLVMEGSAFQRAVWGELLRIPPGSTRSYQSIAEALGKPGAVRAVGKANGDNRLAIVIPCHRVIRADGSLCGYGGGIWRKQRLLELEASPGPFSPARQAVTPRGPR